jgi:hypothetical protein
VTDTPIPPPLPGEPLPPPPSPGAPTSPSATFQDPSSLGKATVVLLFVNVVMAFALLGSTLSEINLLERFEDTGRVDFEDAQRNDNRQRALAGASTLAFVATGIVWLVFVHRAHTNLDALGVRELRFTHGWAVGGFIVPILNLVRAPQSDRSGGTTEWKARPTPGIVPAWWATYIVGFVVRQVSASALRDGPIDDLLLSDRIILGTQVLIAISGVLAAVMIRRVVASQRERAAAAGPGAAAPEGA